MEITALVSQKKNHQRVNIFVEGKFGVGLDLTTVVEEKLAVGQKISESELKRLQDLSAQRKLWEKALKFLSFRPRSEKEARDYLLRKKADEEEIKWVIAQLKEKSYLNDEEFARWWVEQRMTFRPKGWRVLVQELRQKGMGREIIEGIRNSAFAKASADRQESGINERELAQKVAEKKMSTYQKLPPEEFKKKMGQFLARRGFDWEIIKVVVDQVLKKEYNLF